MDEDALAHQDADAEESHLQALKSKARSLLRHLRTRPDHFKEVELVGWEERARKLRRYDGQVYPIKWMMEAANAEYSKLGVDVVTAGITYLNACLDSCRERSNKPGIDRGLTGFLESFAALKQALQRPCLNSLPGMEKLMSNACALMLRRSCKEVPESMFGALRPALATELLQALRHCDDQKFFLRRMAAEAMSSVHVRFAVFFENQNRTQVFQLHLPQMLRM